MYADEEKRIIIEEIRDFEEALANDYAWLSRLFEGLIDSEFRAADVASYLGSLNIERRRLIHEASLGMTHLCTRGGSHR